MRVTRSVVLLISFTSILLPTTSLHVQAATPSACIRMPWQSRDKCSSKLVYAKSNAPKDIRNELERLGAVLDATRDYRGLVNASNAQIQKKCQKSGDFSNCMYQSGRKSKYKGVSVADLENKESLAWLNLYYFAKEWKQYVQASKYSTILTWGIAITKCYPNCKYSD